MANPSTFTQAIADAICVRIADGESLRGICADEDMPDRATVYRWLDANKEFEEQYRSARERQVDYLIDELVEIADDSTRDQFVDDTGKVRTDHEVVQRSKLRVDTRKWIASKLRPKVYGDKLTQELTGKDGGPIQTETAVTIYLPDNGRNA